MTPPPILHSHPLSDRFQALDQFLTEHQHLWKPRPFTALRLDWEAEHPALAAHLRQATLVTALVALAVFFFAKFTRYGAVSLAVAWRSYVNWWAAVFMLFGDFIVDGLSWVAGFWDSFQGQFGSLLNEPSAGKALQVIGALGSDLLGFIRHHQQLVQRGERVADRPEA